MLLARHCESDWNREGRWQGHADRPLTPLGRRQAESLARRLSSVPLEAVYSSDLLRARDTAAAVARAHGLAVLVHADLREVDVGSWSGLTSEEVRTRDPAGIARWERGLTGWHDGETHASMSDRVLRRVEQIGALHSGATVLVVAHGGPIRAILTRADEAQPGPASGHGPRSHTPVPRNGEVSTVRIERGTLARLEFP